MKETFRFINLYPTKTIRKVIPTSELTSKEKQVVQLMFAGYKNSEILIKLSISNSTLKTHINRVYQKIGDEFKILRPSTNGSKN
jgi:ATP/maltotriose-dependent transcriptional regulator MalT